MCGNAQEAARSHRGAFVLSQFGCEVTVALVCPPRMPRCRALTRR